MKRYLAILGTRPETIKMAPIILAAKNAPGLSIEICSTGQHQEMLNQALTTFDLKVDVDLGLMKPNQSLSSLHSSAIIGIQKTLDSGNYAGVIVQGDTTTAFAGALAAFHHQLRIVHIEAGLRTWDFSNPFPEEGNRVLIDSIATAHMAPTATAATNLKNAGIDDSSIYITGNTAVDSLLWMKKKIQSDEPSGTLQLGTSTIDKRSRIVAITGHRRESFGQDFENICEAIRTLAEKYLDVQFVYPVHLNPNVRDPVYRILDRQTNVHLCPPLSYRTFVELLLSSYLVLTDSGGIQEEAPSLDIPTLVMRATTERSEGIEAGCAKLVGVSTQSITDEVSELLDDVSAHQIMAAIDNPYGDGHAAERIIQAIQT